MIRGELLILGEKSNEFSDRTAGALWITEKAALENGWDVIRADYGEDWAGLYGPGIEYSPVLMVLKIEGTPVGISIACRGSNNGKK